MKIVISGALGHIGSKLIETLPVDLKNAELVLIDDLSANRFCSLFNLPAGNFTFVEGKVTDVNLDFLIKGASVVVHLAALTDAAGTSDRPDLVYRNNLDSTKKVADICLKYNVPMIFPSSTSVYGSQASLVDEDCTELAPQSPYADSKIQEESYLRELFAKGLKGNILRFGTIHGASKGMRFHTAVNKFSWQAVTGQALTVWETALDQKRPYLALEDAVSALIFLIKKNHYDNALYNIVTENLTVRQIVNELKLYRPNLEVKLVQHKIMNQLSYEVTNLRSRNLGMEYKGSYKKSIKETMALFESINSNLI